MLLSDSAILAAIENKDIVIEPFNRAALGSNSYDIHLSKHLAVYEDEVLDAARPAKVRRMEIPAEGFVLQPGKLYLGSTLEYTENHKFVPILDGKSSTGRLGICINLTAGTGDIGFCNHWTLNLTCMLPVRIYAGMPIGQLLFFEVAGAVSNPYDKKAGAKYNANRTPTPQESMMWKNKFFTALKNENTAQV